MRFWDASAILPLLAEEPIDANPHDTLMSALDEDPVMLVWWASSTECTSALARRRREESLDDAAIRQAEARLRLLAGGWHEILPTRVLRNLAERMLRVHPLRAADALQLAAAVVAAEQDPASLPFVSLDERLNAAAAREGFPLLAV